MTAIRGPSSIQYFINFIKKFFDAEEALIITSVLPKYCDPSASGTLVNVQGHPSEKPHDEGL